MYIVHSSDPQIKIRISSITTRLFCPRVSEAAPVQLRFILYCLTLLNLWSELNTSGEFQPYAQVHWAVWSTILRQRSAPPNHMHSLMLLLTPWDKRASNTMINVRTPIPVNSIHTFTRCSYIHSKRTVSTPTHGSNEYIWHLKPFKFIYVNLSKKNTPKVSNYPKQRKRNGSRFWQIKFVYHVVTILTVAYYRVFAFRQSIKSSYIFWKNKYLSKLIWKYLTV